ncbi:FAD/NAD(P)-binding domain-containing protein [Teratosphaeria nubilosa]|uniref:FAD/NAD(P)-binding domain-containing protein n=1 Tax=Teratosphaeria nubilosa TaxID=161662 RepID=A0A6G1L193_9PEZI|nr:FAD/NAD(P)-binding domain-containing protein [Teratosphaeria nubilosa]
MAPLDAVVVGAGIGGLAAAAFLRQQGHKVILLERSRFHQEAGAAILMMPNTTGLLAKLNFDFERAGATICNGMARYSADGSLVFDRPWGRLWENTNTFYTIHRADLHAELKRLVLDPVGNGPIPELRLGVKVVDVDVERGTVALEDGQTLNGDFIIGADGNKSFTRQYIDPTAKLKPHGKTIYRWLLSMDAVLAEEQARSMFPNAGYLVDVLSRDTKLVFYPCRHNTALNSAIIIADAERKGPILNDSDGEPLDTRADIEATYDRFSAGVRRLLELAPAEPQAWRLYDMDKLGTWTRGKLALIGDAAHPFLPFLGQGGSQAIEDAAAIAAMLPSSTPAGEVAERLKLYCSTRYEHASFLQEASRINGMDPAKKPASFNEGHCYKYAVDHDEWQNSTRRLHQSLAGRVAA